MSAALEEAARLCTEISLGTYGRKPHEMTIQPQWWHLQKAEELARRIRLLIESELK